MRVNSKESLDSKLLEKSYIVTFIYEDELNFKIKACDDKENYIFHFRLPDWFNMKQKEFVRKIHNFKLLLQTVELAINKKMVTLYKEFEILRITFYYTDIYEEKKIFFELPKQLSEEEEKELIGKYYEDSDALLETKNNMITAPK